MQQVATLLAQQCLKLLALVAWCMQTNATTCQHCWRSSKEVKHSGTVILPVRVRRRFHEANIVVVPCKRTLRRSQNNRKTEMLGLVAQKA